ncbi:hypothetical protein [Cupriavidus plantarum]|uniref:hypothetical protein n=1 Tax=Cupriavidus plantarum TaxID=942865 RepID=UPI000E2537AB|nr:hypothetical protein [Cupriavidus plantarum]REE91211.1 hypothetical protein C7418_4514 [Cupriavidus plantarum]CAG2147277.1 hypothetical protein LMG26296_04066 [Cupriavidus plantarum]SMR85603.1 hypothetical protein SAMN05421735_4410 [Cupriavidus plantarum]
MPFAYAGTRRRRNRDRRRAHDDLQNASPGAQSAAGEKPSEGNGKPKEAPKGEFPPGVGERDLRDPGNRDPDAPPVENNS